MKLKSIMVLMMMVVYSMQGFSMHSASVSAGTMLAPQDSRQDTLTKKEEVKSGKPETSNTLPVAQAAVQHKTLDELYQQANEKVIALETADNMLRDARSISLNDVDDEQADKLMKVYRSVSNSYAENFRFKPAYIVYDEYLGLKNALLERKKNRRLQKIEIETNQLKDVNALKISANEEEIANLQGENESLTNAGQNVYRTIWIVVLIVAFCSGAVIWFINHRYSKAKQLLTANRSRMMEVVLTSAVGEFSQGLLKDNGNSYLKGLDQAKAAIADLTDISSSQSKTSKGLASLKNILSGL